MVKIDMARTMRWARRNIRNGDWHRDCELILQRLIFWGRDNEARVTVSALQRDLHIRRDKIVDCLRVMSRGGAFEIVRTTVEVVCSLGRRIVRGVNRYVFPDLSLGAGPLIIQADKRKAVGAAKPVDNLEADAEASRRRQLAWLAGPGSVIKPDRDGQEVDRHEPEQP